VFFLGLIGVLIGLASYRIAFPHRNPGDFGLFIACYSAHIAATLTYWLYSQSFGADAILYYTDAYGWAQNPFAAGSVFTVQFTQLIKSVFGGTYLDFFLLFQSFGFLGIALIIRSLHEVTADLGQPLLRWEKALLFLPGLHFWTSAIGKDAPLFAAVSLSVWAMINIERRFAWLALAVAIMFPFRPHIAGIVMLSLLATLLFDARIRLVLKVPIALVAIAGAVYILTAVEQSFKMAAFDPEAIGDFLATKQSYGLRTDTGSMILSLPFPLRVLSLLFRPFFLDANGIFGIIVSFENLALLIIFGTLIVRLPTLLRLSVSVIHVRYCLVFAATLIVLLSLVIYNVGLGLRQKYMVMPAILLLFVTLSAYRRALAAPAGAYGFAAQPAIQTIHGPP
jgi:hypothetical protein